MKLLYLVRTTEKNIESVPATLKIVQKMPKCDDLAQLHLKIAVIKVISVWY